MIKVTIDHRKYEFEKEISIIEACHQVGIEIPHFCYHPKLEIAGNCRMCLVDVEGARKPLPSCANTIKDGMEIHTTTDRVRQDREGVMEFLLINHPLDCPVCDQAGECDLQDEALHYGRDRSRYQEEKRAVASKNMGPLISTVMTRCIHCTRCVRFMEDIAGVSEMGALGRGETMEITSYLEQAIHSEVSGNIIDLCPVGALNSKPYQFHGRPWELEHTDSIDVMDAIGSHIRIDSRGGEVLRVLPKGMEEINEIWLSDKSRFACDGLRYQRLDTPYIKGAAGDLVPASWEDAFSAVVNKLKLTLGHKVAALSGDLVDVESVLLMKKLMQKMESQHMDCRIDGAYADVRNSSSFVFNTSLSDIEFSDVCVLVGTNPRWEAPTLNIRLRRGVMEHDMRVYRVGFESDLTYPVEDLGNDIQILQDALDGKGKLANALQRAQKPSIIIGQSALKSDQGSVLLSICAQLAEKYGLISEDGWNGFNVLHTAAGRVGALDLSFVPGENGLSASDMVAASHDGRLEVVFLMGVDEIAPKLSSRTFKVYIGHHGDVGAQSADVVLPGCSYVEKDAIYVNTEGRSQYASKAVDPPGDAKEDWRIISELLKRMDFGEYESLDAVRKELVRENAEFTENRTFKKRHWNPDMGEKGVLKSEALSPVIENFYMTNLISKNSKTMADCVAEVRDNGAANVG